MLTNDMLESKKRRNLVGALFRLQTNAGGNLSVRLSGQRCVVIKLPVWGSQNVAAIIYRWCIWTGRSSRPRSNRLKTWISTSTFTDQTRHQRHCALSQPWTLGFAGIYRNPTITVQTIKRSNMPLIPLSKNGGPQTEVEIGQCSKMSVRAAVLANHGTIGVGKTLTEAVFGQVLETAHVRHQDTLMAGRTKPTCPHVGT
jgi:L-fuculose-phosphate aldolase/L-ribulose-5-phosphate 4-epimerase